MSEQSNLNPTPRAGKRAARAVSNRLLLAAAAVVVVGGATVASLIYPMTSQDHAVFKKAADSAVLSYIPDSEGFGELTAALAPAVLASSAPVHQYEAAVIGGVGSGSAGGWSSMVPAGMDSSAYTGLSATGKVSAWQSTNSDVVGWLKIPGTNINYPVVYHNDVNYYLNLGYYKEPSRNGVIWANPGTTFGSSLAPNTTLYGHNWTNISSSPRVGSPNDVMFAQLTGYHHLSTAQRYPYIYFSTASNDMTFKIFAAFYTDLSFDYISPYPSVSSLVSEAKNRSRHTFDVDVDSSDKILTLSTCTRAYGRTANQRFVVMARLLRPGESTTSYSITANPGHKQPNVW